MLHVAVVASDQFYCIITTCESHVILSLKLPFKHQLSFFLYSELSNVMEQSHQAVPEDDVGMKYVPYNSYTVLM